jgi:WD40 repeat protein
MKKIMILIAMISISACAATPKINTVNSMGMVMELNNPANMPICLAVSPDQKYALSAGWDKTVRIWDLLEGKQTNLLAGHVGWIGTVAFSPNGKYILSGGHDKAVRLWDSSSGKEIRQLIAHKSFSAIASFIINAVAFSPDGTKALSSSADGTIRLWDVEKGKEIMTIPCAGEALGAVFSPDGKYILSGSAGSDGLLKLWDAVSGRPVKEFKHGYRYIGNFVRAVDISPDGRYALGGGSNGLIKVWDIASGAQIKAFPAHTGINGVYSGSFSPDGRYILSGGGDQLIKLWDTATGKEVRQFTGHSEGPVNALVTVFYPDGKHILSAGTDAALRMWDVGTGEEIAMMVGFEDGEWLVITKDGYYNASSRGAKYLNVKFQNKNYTVDQFYDVFYRPDIVANILKGKDIKDLITITLQDVIKSPPPIVEAFPIQDTGSDKVKVCYRVRNSGGGIGEVRIFHNSKLIQSDGYYKEISRSGAVEAQLASLTGKAVDEDMRGVSVMGKIDTAAVSGKAKGDLFSDCRDIETVSGENEVSIAAFNGSNTIQSPLKTINFRSERKSTAPHLYILAIGINQYKDKSANLKYAVKDAQDVLEKFKIQAATLYEPHNIHYTLLADQDAAKANITAEIDDLAKAVKPQDGFILFAAGHGLLLHNQYYLLAHDFNGRITDTSMISSNEIVDASKKIRSLSQLFIFDTCHSGGVDYIISALYDARMSVMAKKMGLHIYASASDKQSAMDGYKGNGLFTHALLSGLNNNREADKNKDGKVSIVGLGEYSKKMTSNISKQIGHEQTPLIINFGKDSPLYKLQ